MDVKKKLINKLDAAQDEIIERRRFLHAHPEVSFKEKNTHEYLKNYYEKLGMPVKNCGDGYGLIIDIDSGRPGKRLLLRADFDALPINEDNDLPFKSQNPGVMHACGHDGHTAYLMVLARCLWELRDQFSGSVRILHQPAEEQTPGGALGMIKAGCLDGVDNAIGIHVMSSMDTGTIGYHSGNALTGRTDFKVTFNGHGGHAAMPQLTNDPLVAGCYFVTGLQTIVSRRIDPFDMASVTVGSFDGAGSHNAIRDHVTLMGDIRIMNEANRQKIHREFMKVVHGVEEGFNVHADVDYQDNYVVTKNDPQFTESVMAGLRKANLKEISKIFDCGPQSPSEDFGYYARQVPSAYFYVGCKVADGGSHPHHSPDFLMNEDCLIVAAKAAGIAALNYLA